MAGLAAAGLALSRGPRRLFDDLSFTLDPGSALVLRGANGSGKTSLLRVLAGLTAPDAGTLAFAGQAWRGLSAARRAAVCYQGHLPGIKDELSAAENLEDLLALDGIVADAAARAAALARAGLAGREHLPARRLSQGQKRRIGLARLALTGKPLWLLDEPTNALDAEGVALFRAMVAAHLADRGMAVIATHLAMDLPAARELALEAAP